MDTDRFDRAVDLEEAGLERRCGECDSVLEHAANFCANCGHAVDREDECSHCGNQLSEDANFCPQCGTARSAVGETGMEPHAEPEPLRHSNTTEQPRPEQTCVSPQPRRGLLEQLKEAEDREQALREEGLDIKPNATGTPEERAAAAWGSRKVLASLPPPVPLLLKLPSLRRVFELYARARDDAERRGLLFIVRLELFELRGKRGESVKGLGSATKEELESMARQEPQWQWTADEISGLEFDKKMFQKQHRHDSGSIEAIRSIIEEVLWARGKDSRVLIGANLAALENIARMEGLL